MTATDALLDWLDAGAHGGRTIPYGHPLVPRLYRLRRAGLVFRQHRTDTPQGRWWMTTRRVRR